MTALLNSTVVVTFNLTGSTYTIIADFGDGAMKCSSNNVTMSNSIFNLTYNYTVEGVYTVSVLGSTDVDPCSTSTTLNLTVENVPTSLNISCPEFVVAYESTVFKESVTADSGIIFYSEFGDGQTDTVVFANRAPHNKSTAFTKTYWNLSMFVVCAAATNAVGGLGGFYNVTTYQRINNLTFYGNTSLLAPPGLGRWGVGLGQNLFTLYSVSCSWTIGSAQTTTAYGLAQLNASTPHEIPYTYSADDFGAQMVSVNCSNSISWQFYSMNVSVFDVVQLSTLTSAPPVYWNDTTILTLNVTRVATGNCFEVNMGDGTPLFVYQTGPACNGPCSPGPVTYVPLSGYTVGQKGALVMINYTYALIGNYTVKVRAFNSVSNATLTTSTIVKDWLCSVPIVTLNSSLTKPTNPYTTTVTAAFNVTPFVNVSCMKHRAVLRTWDVFDATLFEAAVAAGQTPPPAFINVPDALTFVPPWLAMQKDKYVVRLTVSLVTKTPYFDLSPFTVVRYAYVNVTRTPLVIGVVCGHDVNQPFNSTIKIDASNFTYDPDVNNVLNKTGMHWKWLCKMENETWPAVPPVVTQQPFVVGGAGGCYGGGPGIVAVFTDLTFDLDTSYFEPLVNYTLRLLVTKDERMVTYDVAVYVNVPAAPVMQIRYVGQVCLEFTEVLVVNLEPKCLFVIVNV